LNNDKFQFYVKIKKLKIYLTHNIILILFILKCMINFIELFIFLTTIADNRDNFILYNILYLIESKKHINE